MIPVCETFTSIQGEVQGIGAACFFVRVFGCNLGPDCTVDCDTPYSWKDTGGGTGVERVAVDELAIRVLSSGQRSVVITGGEPLMYQQALHDLIDRVTRTATARVTWYIETNGTIAPSPALVSNPAVFFNVSPKLPAFSHDPFPIQRSVFKHIIDRSTMGRVGAATSALPESIKARTYFMPSSKNREDYLALAPAVAAWCAENGFNFGPRLHLVLWDGRRGT